MHMHIHVTELIITTPIQTSFFNNISHEFRTPLTLILGALENIMGRAVLESHSDVGASLNLVKINANRLLQLVNNLLEFSSFEAK